MWSNLNVTVESNSGGFLNDSRGSKSGGEKRKTQRGQNIVPVMIRHLTCCSADLKLWGTPVQTVTFVGILRHLEQATTKITYEIEDETGRIAAFKWLEPDRIAVESMFELNNYVRVYGYLREQNEKKHILVSKIYPMIELNELTNHLLEVTYVMLKSEKKNTHKEHSHTDDCSMLDENFVGLTKEQAVIFKIIQAENNSENGIERSVLKSRVPKDILPSVDNIIDFFTSEGHIYTTLTDNHFKTT